MIKYKSYKDYKIYRVKWQGYEHTDKRFHKVIRERQAFYEKLFVKFSGATFEELYLNPDPILSALYSITETGFDLLDEKYGILITEQWKSDYIFIPKDEEEIIKFFEENKPNWVKPKKKIALPFRVYYYYEYGIDLKDIWKAQEAIDYKELKDEALKKYAELLVNN